MTNFSEALEAVKAGKKILRSGWNGENQFIITVRAGNAMYTKNDLSYLMQDCLGLKNVHGYMQPGWIPSQDDLFANDWIIKD